MSLRGLISPLMVYWTTEEAIVGVLVRDRERPTTRRYVKTQPDMLVDHAKVAKQFREWSFRFDGAKKPFEFLEQVEWSANTYGLDLDMIPRAIPELLKEKVLK